MDNGQHGVAIKPSDDFKKDTAFFTAGVGDTPAENNNYQPENNLDEENWQQALEISTPLGMPSPAEAAKLPEATKPIEEAPGAAPNLATHANVSKSPEDHPKIPEFPNFKPPEENDPKLGQITTIENSINLPEVKKQSGYNPDSIKITGDKLEQSSIAEVDNVINELNQTGNLSNFYEEVRSMTEANLSNSFNRKLYHENTDGGGK